LPFLPSFLTSSPHYNTIFEHTLDLATQMGLPVREEPLPLTSLERAREAFVTNAVIGVVPLLQIEGRQLAETVIGQMLRGEFLRRAFGML
jgi:branched-subunit amino acid aminotransferase/4-amino-4-deoxychorismate lyase